MDKKQRCHFTILQNLKVYEESREETILKWKVRFFLTAQKLAS